MYYQCREKQVLAAEASCSHLSSDLSKLPVILRNHCRCLPPGFGNATQLCAYAGLVPRVADSTHANVDLATVALDAPVEDLRGSGTQSLIALAAQHAKEHGLTMRDLGLIYGESILVPQLCGTATQIAEQLAEIFTSGDADGFVISPAGGVPDVDIRLLMFWRINSLRTIASISKSDHRTFVHFTIWLFEHVILSVAKNLSERPFVSLRVTHSVCQSFVVRFRTPPSFPYLSGQ